MPPELPDAGSPTPDLTQAGDPTLNPFASEPTNNPVPGAPGPGGAPLALGPPPVDHSAVNEARLTLASPSTGSLTAADPAASSSVNLPVGQQGLDDGSLPQGVFMGASDLERRIEMLARMHPALTNDPQSLVQLAQLPVTDDTLAGTVGQAAMSTSASVQADILNRISDPHVRFKMWQSLTAPMQHLVSADGFTPPPDPNTHKGFWQQLSSKVGPVAGIARLAHDVNNDIVKPIGRSAVVHGAMHALGYALNVPSRLYRMSTYDPRTGGSNELSEGTQGAPINNPSAPGTFQPWNFHWVRMAWDATAPGRPLYTDEALGKAARQIGDNAELQGLARYTAMNGGDVTAGAIALLGKPTPGTAGAANPAYQQKMQQMLADAQANPGFADAVKTLSKGSVSPGRDLARLAGLREGTTPYHELSGGFDAAFQWYANPLAHLGKVKDVFNSARAISSGAQMATELNRARMADETATAVAGRDTRSPLYWLHQLAHTPGPAAPVEGSLFNRMVMPAETRARQRMMISLADHVEQGNFKGWSQAFPKAGGMYDSFQGYATDLKARLAADGVERPLNGNDVNDWLHSKTGSISVADGSAPAYLSPNDTEIPHLSRGGALRIAAKVGLTDFGRIADMPIEHSDLLESDSGAAPAMGTAQKVLSGMSNKVYQLLRPTNTDGVVSFVGPDRLSTFERFVNQFGFDPARRAGVLNAFASAEGTAEMRDVVLQTLDAGLKRMGLDATKEGRDVVDNLVEAQRQNYDPNGLDILPSGLHSTLAPDVQAAQGISVPTLQNLAKAMRDTNTASVTNNVLLNPTFEAFMHRVWAPLALMRIGFIPRVVSEEWMTALMRLHPSQVTSAYIGEWLPAIQDRVAAWDPLARSGPISMARILGRHALGVSLSAAQSAAEATSPGIIQAGRQVYTARKLVKHGQVAWKELTGLAGDKAAAADLLGVSHDNTEAVGAELASKRDEVRELFERIAEDPIIKRAWGKAVFSTGGGYRGAWSVTGDLKQMDGRYNPVEVVKMRSNRKVFHGPAWNREMDPGFMQAVADYYDELGRSPMMREGLKAIQGWVPSINEEMAVRDTLHQSTPEARETFASLPAHQQDVLRRYVTTLGSGDKAAFHPAGLAIRDLLKSDSQQRIFTDRQRDLIHGVAGDPEYWKQVATGKVLAHAGGVDPVMGDRGQQLLDEIGGRLPTDLSPSTLASLFADHKAPLVATHDQAVDMAHEAMMAHALRPENADWLRSWSHYLHSPAGDLAEAVPEGHTRVYFANRALADQPAEVRLGSNDPSEWLHQWSSWKRGEEAGDGQVFDHVGFTNPANAAKVAQLLGSPVSYVDLPDELAHAQDLVNPYKAAAGKPWHDVTDRTLDATHELIGDLENSGAMTGMSLSDGKWLNPGQVANSRTIDGPAVRFPDGSLSPGVDHLTAVRTATRRSAESLVNAFAPRGQLLHSVVQDILRHDGKASFTAANLSGLEPRELPELVSAGESIHLPQEHLWGRIVRNYFDKVVGPSIDSMVRSPLFILNYAKSMRAAKIVEPHLVDKELRLYAARVIKGSGLDVYHARAALRQKAELDMLTERGLKFSDEDKQARWPLAGDAQDLIDRATARDTPLPRRFSPPDHGWFYHGSRGDTRTGELAPLHWTTHDLAHMTGPGFYTTSERSVAQGWADRGDNEGDLEARVHGVTWPLDRPPNLLDLEQPAQAHVDDAIRTVIRAHHPEMTREELDPKIDELIQANKEHYGDPSAPNTNWDLLQGFGSHAHGMGADLPSEGNPGLAMWADLHSILKNQGYDGFSHSGMRDIGGSTHRIFFNPEQLQYAAPTASSHERAMHAWSDHEDNIEDHLRQIAVTRAIKDTTPFINDHNARSNLAEWGRNIAPFGWAQESFLKRWWRASMYNPSQLARLELGIHGLASMGVIHKDAYGQDALTWPGTAQLSKVLAHLGVPYSNLVSVPFSSEIRNMTPGFNRPAQPAWGPFISVPLALASTGQPSASPLAQTISGAGAKPGPLAAMEQIIPVGMVRNVASAIYTNLDQQQYASARMQVTQMLAAGGHLPPINASPDQIHTWNDRVDTLTKSLLLIRATLGFVGPATPTLDFQGKTVDGVPVSKLNGDLQNLIAIYGASQGVAKFVATHPDATPYTIFRSTAAGMMAPPATQAALDAMGSNRSFFKRFPAAGAYFLPAGDGTFSRAAELAQQADGMRRAKGWDTIVSEMVTASASMDYYAAHDNYIKAIASAQGDTARQAQMRKVWSAWSQQFLAANPVFDAQLKDSTSTAQRAAVLAEMRTALQSGDAPAGPATTALTTLLNGYDSWQAARTPLSAIRDSAATQRRKRIDDTFALWAEQFAKGDPATQAFYARIIVPEIASADRNVGQLLEASNLAG